MTPFEIVRSPPNYGKHNDGKSRYLFCPLYNCLTQIVTGMNLVDYLLTDSEKKFNDIFSLATRANYRLFPELRTRTVGESCLQNCMTVVKLHLVHKEINDNHGNNRS